jgi:hypothetical protein
VTTQAVSLRPIVRLRMVKTHQIPLATTSAVARNIYDGLDRDSVPTKQDCRRLICEYPYARQKTSKYRLTVSCTAQSRQVASKVVGSLIGNTWFSHLRSSSLVRVSRVCRVILLTVSFS